MSMCFSSGTQHKLFSPIKCSGNLNGTYQGWYPYDMYNNVTSHEVIVTHSLLFPSLSPSLSLVSPLQYAEP